MSTGFSWTEWGRENQQRNEYYDMDTSVLPEGEVLINGHDILKEPEEAKKQIGYLPELPPLYMEMTVREYLEFVAELKGIAKNKREESINEVEKMVKIWEVENRLIRNLSKGYRQRDSDWHRQCLVSGDYYS